MICMIPKLNLGADKYDLYLRNRLALAVNCCLIIHCLEVSCKEDQITINRIITQKFTRYLELIYSILTRNKRRKHI